MNKQQRQRRQRRRRERQALYDPSVPLTGRALRRAARQITRAEFDPKRRALNREARAISSTGNELADRASNYYLQLAQQEAGNVDKMRALGDSLRGDVAAAGATAQSQLAAAGDQAAQLNAADLAVRGQGNATGMNATLTELAAARARATANEQTAQTDVGASTANWAGLADASRTARSAAGGESVNDFLRDIAIRRADVRRRRSDLDASAAAARAQNVLKLRQQEIENQVTAQGLNVDLERIDASRDIARGNRRAANRRAAAQRRTTERGQDISAEQRTADRQARTEKARLDRLAKARKEGTRLMDSDARKLRNGISNAFADLNSKKPPHPERWLRRQGAPGIVIEAAMQRYTRGGILPATAAELRRLGIRVPRGWLHSNLGPEDIPGVGEIINAIGG